MDPFSDSAVAACFGIALAYLLGVFFTWRVSARMVALLNFITMICLTTLPKSNMVGYKQLIKTRTRGSGKIGASSDSE